jgi:hypothetical protein
MRVPMFSMNPNLWLRSLLFCRRHSHCCECLVFWLALVMVAVEL